MTKAGMPESVRIALKTQPATGETYPKSDLFNKALLMMKINQFHQRLKLLLLLLRQSPATHFQF